MKAIFVALLAVMFASGCNRPVVANFAQTATAKTTQTAAVNARQTAVVAATKLAQEMVNCNPSWRELKISTGALGGSRERAISALEHELKRWTRVEFLPPGENVVQIYLTYLSPQVIEAIIAKKAIEEHLSGEEAVELLGEYERRLQTKNAIPFLMTVRGIIDPDIQISFGYLQRNMVMVNQRHEEIFPLLEYTPAFDQPINMGDGGLEGYILFPRSIRIGCNPSVDLLNDHSFDIRLNNISMTATCFWCLADETQSVNALWPYTLLPDIHLEEALNIPLPQRATAELSSSDLLDILGLALSLFEMFAK